MKCTECIYMVQGEGSAVCCHPSAKMKYIYHFGYNDCIIPGKGRKIPEGLTQDQQQMLGASNFGWVKKEKTINYSDGSKKEFTYYEPK